MQKFNVRVLNDDSQKTLEQRARETGLPAAHQKKMNWPFLVADTPVATPDHDTNQPVLPS
ncbi:MAG: hypothetical protein ACYCZL_11080 [Polaromonas sp.]